jgi:hypothetical protein
MIAPASGVYGGADPLADNTSRFFVQVKFNFHLREIMITTVRQPSSSVYAVFWLSLETIWVNPASSLKSLVAYFWVQQLLVKANISIKICLIRLP